VERLKLDSTSTAIAGMYVGLSCGRRDLSAADGCSRDKVLNLTLRILSYDNARVAYMRFTTNLVTRFR
jgi:hypothetical protein